MLYSGVQDRVVDPQRRARVGLRELPVKGEQVDGAGKGIEAGDGSSDSGVHGRGMALHGEHSHQRGRG